MPINDVHCHFFSTEFFATLARQRSGPAPVRSPLREEMERELVGAKLCDDLCAELQWEPPGSAYTLAARWVTELDAHGVDRAALIASIPGDETSVAAAVAKRPDRFVGFFMLDPSSPEPAARARRALTDLRLRGICLFPAMHRVPLHDERVEQVVEVAAEHPGTAVFVHCGVLSVGVRRRLGLPSPFEFRLGNPLDLQPLARQFANVPVIVPHFGAGLFREALMLAESCANVHLDTSSSNAWMRYVPGLTLSQVFRAAIDVVGSERLLFGTDSSFFPRGWNREVRDQQMKALGDALASPDARAQILSRNFQRLFPD
jgi:predicted TIM-barrel fold metal-dependent hydrolase